MSTPYHHINKQTSWLLYLVSVAFGFIPLLALTRYYVVQPGLQSFMLYNVLFAVIGATFVGVFLLQRFLAAVLPSLVTLIAGATIAYPGQFDPVLYALVAVMIVATIIWAIAFIAEWDLNRFIARLISPDHGPEGVSEHFEIDASGERATHDGSRRGKIMG